MVEVAASTIIFPKRRHSQATDAVSGCRRPSCAHNVAGSQPVVLGRIAWHAREALTLVAWAFEPFAEAWDFQESVEPLVFAARVFPPRLRPPVPVSERARSQG
jgi:hypothetical protein